MQRWVRDLNRFYRSEPALYELDFTDDGFEWIDCNDADDERHQPILRKGARPSRVVLVVCNFTPVPREQLPRRRAAAADCWREALNSDATDYGGSGLGNAGGVEAKPVPQHGRPYSLSFTSRRWRSWY